MFTFDLEEDTSVKEQRCDDIDVIHAQNVKEI